jgi:MoaD family protein
MAAVRIPPTLRADVGGARELAAEGDTVAEVLDDLVERYPPLRAQLLQEGELAPFVNVYVGGEDVRTRDGLETPVRDGDQLILLPAMAGGAL